MNICGKGCTWFILQFDLLLLNPHMSRWLVVPLSGICNNYNYESICPDFLAGLLPLKLASRTITPTDEKILVDHSKLNPFLTIYWLNSKQS
jgi:hypothetical protein